MRERIRKSKEDPNEYVNVRCASGRSLTHDEPFPRREAVHIEALVKEHVCSQVCGHGSENCLVLKLNRKAASAAVAEMLAQEVVATFVPDTVNED